jgi:AraC family transcriptional regulator, regulatory protein of adaptative response / methylphosphotriester-DNA alkyltransferase methyltransferase
MRTMAPSMQRLSITHVRAGGRRVLVLRGEVDLDTAPALIAAFTRAARGDDPLAVDLCEADVADKGGMALLVNAVRRLHRRRGDIVVVCPPGAVHAVLERTGIARRFPLPERADALAGPELEPDALTPGPEVVGGHRQRVTTPGRRATLLAEATLVIEMRHPDPTLSLDDVAREIATSSRQLQRVFAELAGSTFRAELAAVRMQHAAALLQATDLPVSEIARRVGYRQAAQFAKAFRRHHGVSPSGLRRARPGRATPAGMATVYVTGQRNPDTDSIASAIRYAELERLGPRLPVGRRHLNQRHSGAATS